MGTKGRGGFLRGHNETSNVCHRKLLDVVQHQHVKPGPDLEEEHFKISPVEALGCTLFD